MALNGLFCADVPLRNYSLTHSLLFLCSLYCTNFVFVLKSICSFTVNVTTVCGIFMQLKHGVCEFTELVPVPIQH